MSPPLQDRMSKIRLLLLDVDGVLSNGAIYLGDAGEFKAFNTQDGLGIKLAQRCGIQVGIITGRSSKAVSRRAEELKLDFLYQSTMNKREAYAQILQQTGLEDEAVCYMGDDLPDLPLIIRAGVGVAPANASKAVQARADLTTAAAGGEGAVREVIESILKAQGQWDAMVQEFLD